MDKKAGSSLQEFTFTPTLVVGLGGTGASVLTYLKSSLLKTYGENIFKIVQLRCFDTEDVASLERTPSKLDAGTEFVHIGNVPVRPILDNLQRFPYLESWLPRDIPAYHTNFDAQGVRSLGRLAFFHHYSAIRARLQSAIEVLRGLWLRDMITGHDRLGINVFIVSSLAGGTGSGIFLDAAYLIRHLMGMNGGGEYVLNGVLVLPGVFSPLVGADVQRSTLRPNAYASLRELDFFSREKVFSAQYPNKELIDIRSRPFDLCFLLDSANGIEPPAGELHELPAKLVRSIFRLIQVQAVWPRFRRVVHFPVLDQTDVLGFSTAFSAMGATNRRFAADKVAALIATRLGSRLIRNFALTQPKLVKPVETEALEFFRAAHLGSSHLLNELSRAPNSQVMAVRLLDEVLAGVSTRKLMQRTRSYLEQNESHLNTTLRQLVENRREQLVLSLRRDTDRHVTRLVNSPDFGLIAAINWLRSLRNMADNLAADYLQLRTACEEKRPALTQKAHEQEIVLAQATASFPQFRNRQIKVARQGYLEACTRQFQNEFEIIKLSEANVLLADWLESLRDIEQKLDTLRRNLDRIAVEFEDEHARLRELGADDMQGAVDLIYSDELLDHIYHGRLPRPESIFAGLLERAGGLHFWMDKNQQELVGMLSDYCEQISTQFVSEIKMDDLIVWSAERSSHEYYQKLREESHPQLPLKQLEKGSVPPGAQTVKYIGVYDTANSSFKTATQSDEELVPTADPHSLFMLSTTHGIAIHALHEYNLYRRTYLKRQGSRPGHKVFSEVDLTVDAAELVDLHGQHVGGTATGPRVFISYSHDSPEHKGNVRALCHKLRQEDFDCHIDADVEAQGPLEQWPRWMVLQVEQADYVLMVCTETYLRRTNGREIPGRGKGANFEGLIITNELYAKYGRTTKFIPVIFSKDDVRHIPVMLIGANYYQVSTEEGYENLRRHLLAQPYVAQDD